jgi:membrane protein implicated in regulation of membrane protease activity
MSTEPDTSELVEGLLFYPIALVISATIAPGLTLCIPGLIFATALILLPLVAVGIVILVVAAVVAAPVLLVRAVRKRVASQERVTTEAVPAKAIYFGRPSLASAGSAHMVMAVE